MPKKASGTFLGGFDTGEGNPVAVSSMKKIVWAALVLSGLAEAAEIREEVQCPHDPQESCRWEITAKSSPGPKVEFAWNKAVVSRHWEKPLSNNLQCNVDRDFDAAAGGYLKVWFQGESQPCDAMAGNPADCGVTFHLEDPAELHSSHSVSVVAPAGKRLARVQLLNTLNLQCGNFGRPGYLKLKWRPIVGWSAKIPGDGTYQSGAPAETE
jgi:hypothetical protein